MLHYGQIVEKIVRRNGHSISDVARLANVNRRSVYNWFNQRQLKPEIIYRIGCVINHDFSEELPELFTPEDFQKGFKRTSFLNGVSYETEVSENKQVWKDKYIELLERYNNLLLNTISAEV